MTVNTLATAVFPLINQKTLTNGMAGNNAGIGTLQTAQAPQITFGQPLTGNFDCYVWAVMPSSIVVTGKPNGLALRDDLMM